LHSFAAKGRRQLLRDEGRGQFHAYITGILKNHDSPLIETTPGYHMAGFQPSWRGRSGMT